MNTSNVLRGYCPGCGRDNALNKKVFERDFSYCKDIMAFKYYEVYQCEVCHLVYAGNIEESIPITDYYEKMSRYEGDNYVISHKLKKHYDFVVSTIAPTLRNDAFILDVGCAFGGLLYEFKQKGFKNVFGLEPSKKNCIHAMDEYGIKVYQGSLEKYRELNGKKFDIVILNGVLEHLIDIKNCISYCKKLLNKDGFIALTVPDISMFKEHKDIYQEFSAEHINYFGIDSLSYIMSNEGFSRCIYEQDHESLMGLSGNMITLWQQRGGEEQAFNTYDLRDSRDELTLYMDLCKKFKDNVLKRMNRYDQCKYYIWGAGTNTAILVQLGIIKKESILGVFDSNKNYQGYNAYGHVIEDPYMLLEKENYPILISSQYAFNAIRTAISNMGLANSIIDLFSDE